MGHREKENVAEGSGCSVRCLYWRHMSQETNTLEMSHLHKDAV